MKKDVVFALHRDAFNSHISRGSTHLVLLSRNATSAGSLKLAQNILFFGATSLTSYITNSSSPGFTSYPNFSDIRWQISIPSLTLSSLFVEKQWTWIIGNLVFV